MREQHTQSLTTTLTNLMRMSCPITVSGLLGTCNSGTCVIHPGMCHCCSHASALNQ
jgi:hypothetical protein